MTRKRHKEATCANCEECSLSGKFCHRWGIPTELWMSCDLHSGKTKRKNK